MSKHYKSFNAENKLKGILDEAIPVFKLIAGIVVVLFVLTIITENGIFVTGLEVMTSIYLFIAVFIILANIVCFIVNLVNIRYAKEYLKEAISKYWPEDIKMKGLGYLKFYYDGDYIHCYHIELEDKAHWYSEIKHELKEEIFENIRLDLYELEYLWPTQRGRIRVYVGIDYVSPEELIIYLDKE